MKAISPFPKGYPRVSPYLILNDAAAAIEFYKTVLGAKERMRMNAPGGKIGHAELEIGDSLIMLADEYPQMGFLSAKHYGGTPVSLAVYVENCDETFSKAIAAGAKQLKPVQDQFYGDRSGTFQDPWGHVWTVATHIEDLTPEEMAERAAKLAGS